MALSYAISALPAIVTYASGDLLPIVDISDFTEAPTGTTKKITVAQLFTTPTFTGTVTASGSVIVGGSQVSLTADGAELNTTFSGVTTTRLKTDASGGLLSVDGVNALRFRTNGVDRITIAGTGNATFSGAVNTSQLQISTAVSRIVPGATSLLIRNNADTVTNLSVTDAGVVTVPGTFGVTGVATFSDNVNIAAGQSIGTATSNDWYLKSAASARWIVQATGHFVAFADNTYDIGASGANRPRNVFVSNSVVASGNITAAGLSGVLTVGTGTAAAGTIFKTAANGTTIQGAAGSSNDFVLTSSSNLLVANVPTGTSNIVFAGNVTVGGLAIVTKLKGGSSAPTPSAGANAGTGATVSVSTGSTDTFGEVSVTLGGSPSAGTSLVTVTYSAAYSGNAPFPNISYSNLTSTSGLLYINAYTTSGFTVGFANAAGVSTGSTFKFTYSVGQ